MRIAVDAGALAIPGDGIGRYVRELVARLSHDDAHHLLLYARAPLAATAAARVRTDGLPAVSGRVLALCTSLPVWAAIDRPDLYWGPAHRLPLALPSATARVVTIHDLCWARVPDTMRTATRLFDRWWMPRAVAQADRIIAVSASTADDLRETFPRHAERIRVVHEAAIADARPDRDALARLGVGTAYVLFVGTLEPRKNLLRLLDAYVRVRDAMPQPPCLVLAGGAGWGDLPLAAAIDRLGLRAHVVLTGRVDDGTLAALYAGARCLALPSLYEGFGLPLVEAMTHGTPVLTSNVSSMPEVAGDAGVLVDPRDVDAIANGLLQLVRDDALHARLSANARVQAARYSWERAARETLAVFEEAVEERRLRGLGPGA